MPIVPLIALLLLALAAITAPAYAEPRLGTYLETGYFARLVAGSPTAAALGVGGPTAIEIRTRRNGAGIEAIAVLGWHEGFDVALSSDVKSTPCNCGAGTEIPIEWEITSNDPPDHLAIRNRQDNARFTFRWAGPVAEIAVAYHAIGGTWHDAQGGTYVFTATGEWRTPGATHRYRLLLDHFFYDEDILELVSDPADTSVPRTEDGKPILTFEVPRPGTLVLRRLRYNGQDVFFPYDPAEVWRILRR